MVLHTTIPSVLETDIQFEVSYPPLRRNRPPLLRLSALQTLVKTIIATEQLVTERLGDRFYLGCKDVLMFTGIVRDDPCKECGERKYVCLEGSYCLRCLEYRDENTSPELIR